MLKKKRILWMLIPMILLYSCVPDADQEDKKMRMATLNCYFLWDGLEPEEGNPAVQFPHKGNPELAYEHMKKIAALIRQLDADLINLVEVEGIDALQFMVDTFLSDMDYHIGFVKGIDTYTGQDVALLSKFPIENMMRYAEKGLSETTEKSVSKNYVADVTVHGKKLSLIGIHLLALPYNTSRVNERQAQADAMNTVALQKMKEGREVVVLGDFNDYEGDSCCTDLLTNFPITTVLSQLKSMDTSVVHDNLVNVLTYIDKSNRYTVHWDQDEEGDVDQSELSAIDHILLSPMLSTHVTNAFIKHDFNPFEVSDHYPVVVDLEF